MATSRPARSSAPILPILLIAVGIVILVANAGIFDWDVLFGVLQLWPLLLIAIGADLFLGGRQRLLIAIVTVAVGVLLYSGVLTVPGLTPVPSETHTISQGLEGATRATVRLQPSVGELRIRAQAGGDGLVEGTVQTGRGERLDQRFSSSGGVALLELQSQQAARGMFGIRGGRDWDLAFSPGVPIEFDIEAGVGRVDLDLSTLSVADLRLRAGVGETNVLLAAEGSYRARIDSGVGRTVVRIPEGLAARIQVTTGIGSVQVRGEYQHDGDFYVSPGFEQAANRVELSVEGGVGGVTIEPR